MNASDNYLSLNLNHLFVDVLKLDSFGVIQIF